MAYSLTRYEMETTVNFNAEEKEAKLYSQDKAVIRRMAKLVREFPDIFRVEYETSVGKAYIFPKKYAMPKRPRILSEEQRAKMAARLAKIRDNKDADEDELEEEELMDEEELMEEEEEDE